MTPPTGEYPPRVKVFFIELVYNNKQRLYASFELMRKASYKKKRELMPRLREAWRIMADKAP